MIKYDPKHYFDKPFRVLANRWWRTLSINEMKSFEKKHGIISHMAGQSEIAAIYDAEVYRYE